MSRQNLVDVCIFVDGQIIEDANYMLSYSVPATTYMKISRSITFVELVNKVYESTRINPTEFLIKKISKYSFEDRNLLRQRAMKVKNDGDLSFFLDPYTGVSTMDLYIEKAPIQSQGQYTSLLTQMTSYQPNQFSPFCAQPLLPDLSISSYPNEDMYGRCSTSGNAFGGVENVPNFPLAAHDSGSYAMDDEDEGMSTHSHHEFGHFDEGNYSAHFSHHGGASSSIPPQNDQFEDENDSACRNSLDGLSDTDLEAHMNNDPNYEENAEEDVPRTDNQPRLHPVLSFYSTSYEELQGDSLNRPREVGDMTYDYQIGKLGLGLTFENKESLQRAVKDYHVTHEKREFTVKISNQTTYVVVCKHKNEREGCKFRLRAHFSQKIHFWMISKYKGPHECMFENVDKNHHNLDMNLIANELLGQVQIGPSIKVARIVQMVNEKWKCQISYGKASHSLQRANEIVYGTWENSIPQLPKFLGAIQKWNSGTVVEWKHKSIYQNPKIFMYVFWAFKPCIDGFQHCRRVICVDGTHLHAWYKGKLLIATTLDGNNQILPLAFAIVDNESNDSWLWFLQLVSKHFIRRNEGVCLISDRHHDIRRASELVPAFCPPHGSHRYCLRHVYSNFNTRFNNKVLKTLCYQAGMTHSISKFDKIMQDIRQKEEEAFIYLSRIPFEKWTLTHDGGVREGIMTTNRGESLNGVLKGVRHLPPTAIVECTFHRCVDYFYKRHRDGLTMGGNSGLTDYAYQMYSESQKASETHIVRHFDHLDETGQVNTKAQLGYRSVKYAVDLKRKYCSCGRWSTHKIPCSHAIALCVDLHKRSIPLVEKYYRASEYLQTYQGKFFPLHETHFWDVPNFELVHDPLSKIQRRVGKM